MHKNFQEILVILYNFYKYTKNATFNIMFTNKIQNVVYLHFDMWYNNYSDKEEITKIKLKRKYKKWNQLKFL